MKNHQFILNGSRSGCYYCLAEFDGIQITEWQDGTGAHCSNCGNVTVIPFDVISTEPVKYLLAARDYWFNEEQKTPTNHNYGAYKEKI